MVQKPKRRRLSLNCWHFSAIWDRDVRFPPYESCNILVFVPFMPCVIIIWNHVWKQQLLSCQTFFSWKILQISLLPKPTAGDPNSWCFWLFLDQFWHNICLKIYVRKSWVKLLKFLQPRANSMPSIPRGRLGLIRWVSGITPGFHPPQWPTVAFRQVSLVGPPLRLGRCP